MAFAFGIDHAICISITDNLHLQGLLHIPEHAKAIVLFAHGSGSGRLSPRNQFIAKELQSATIATLLFDLLTENEESIDERTTQYRFDIPFLAERLVAASQYVGNDAMLSKLNLGYFGASTGGGAALVAAAILGQKVKAVVSRGGRPDLAFHALPHVQAATLLIVGALDLPVIELNQTAFDQLKSIKKLEIVPGATHLFEEEGKLGIVAQLAVNWFKKYL